jgi:hypothetical protein
MLRKHARLMRSRLSRKPRAMCDSVCMKNNRKKFEAELVKGQVWRTGDAYLQIMDRGKRLISYKMMKELGKRAVRTQMSSIADVEAYLKANDAELIETAA